MDQPIRELLRRSTVLRGILTVAATLFLGALGSGLWELFLKDLFLGLGNWILALIAGVWSGYVDRLHANIGQLRQDHLLIPVFSFFAAAAIVGPWFLVHSAWNQVESLHRKLHEPPASERHTLTALDMGLRRIRRKILRLLVPITFAATTMFLILTWQLLYTRSASTWAEHSLEIIAPHVAPEDRVRLRAELRLVVSAKQFFALRQKLQEHSARAGVQLPKFTPIGE